jgi:thiamine-monophosphate kinase
VTGNGEFDLIARLVESVEAARRERSASWGPQVRLGSGDDAAITVPSGATATSVDAMVEGIHFRRDAGALSSVGRKALATALSDLAAMGADPGEAYVQLGVPDDLDNAGCAELARGLAEVAADHSVAVLGGDVTRSPALMLALTVVGHAPSPADLVTRSGARPGDVLAVTGELGGAAAGLLVLEQPELARGLDPRAADGLRLRQLEPNARLDAGLALARSGATAMVDLSDGLGGDARHLADASGVEVVIELARVPLQDGVASVAEAAGVSPQELAAERGEDYELLVALPEAAADEAMRAVEATGLALTPIGRVRDGAGVVLLEPDGSARRPSGFDQLEG